MSTVVAQTDMENVVETLQDTIISLSDDENSDNESENPSSDDDYYCWYSDSEDESTIPPGLPVLPDERKFDLSPSHSQENLTLDSAIESVKDSAAGSSFFERLPLEIRQKIYIAAFGERTIHMDLNFDRPGVRGATHESVDLEKCSPEYSNEPPTEWFWSSSTCHRNPLAEACHDQCRIGGNHTMCSLFPGTAPDKCNLGVMGWLLTCRQAYGEAINILYATNTIHIASFALMRYVPLLFLPQRLSSIKSLELIWDLLLFCPISNSGYSQLVGWPVYFEFVRSVIIDFPHLKTLYISIQIGTHMEDKIRSLRRVEHKLFAPLDEVMKLTAEHVESLEVAIPSSYHSELAKKAEKSGTVIESGGEGDFTWRRYWRPVILQQDGKPTKNLGYWIRQGIDDSYLKEAELN